MRIVIIYNVSILLIHSLPDGPSVAYAVLLAGSNYHNTTRHSRRWVVRGYQQQDTPTRCNTGDNTLLRAHKRIIRMVLYTSKYKSIMRIIVD